MSDEIKDIISKIDKQLKNFQKASVKYVIKQLFEENRRKVLIADEVGLGKTIVAKGVIAKSVEKYGKKDKPFHVVYICSNQVLAQQNLGKLNPFKENPHPLSRLIFLAKQPPKSKNSLIRLSSLTPNTSFKLTQSAGVSQERAILFWLLYQYQFFRNRETTFKRFMKYGKGDDSWNREIAWIKREGQNILRPKLYRRFKRHLQKVPFCHKRFWRTAQYLDYKEFNSLYDGLKALIDRICRDRKRSISGYSYEIIRALRGELTKVCVRFLNADLFILDEFQRFKTLLDGEDTSEAGEIAKRVLQNDEARVLLLSATPFKPYTTQLEQLNGESHHHEFRKVVKFLGGEKGQDLWEEFREHQEAFFQILRHPETAIKEPDEAIFRKKELENSFHKFLSRNERMSVANKFDNMVKHPDRDNIGVEKGDIQNFIAIDQLVKELANLSPHRTKRFGSTLEFSKSAPYPLSYLYGYKLRKILDEFKEEEEIKRFFKLKEAAWLPYKKINNYEPIDAGKEGTVFPNGKLRVLAKECFANQAEKLLWVPPSKPYYEPQGVYEMAKDFSKVLIFSGWVMVPRAISTLLSFEAERKTIGVLNKKIKQPEPITYFERKKVVQQLRYKKTNTEDKVRYTMNNFVLSYPSVFLVLNSIYFNSFEFGQSYKEIHSQQVQKLNILFSKNRVREKFIRKKNVDKKWYWIAAPLLDAINGTFNDYLNPSNFINHIRGDKRDHLVYLQKIVNEVLDGKKFLGEYPDDLFDVLADMILSSPANSVLHGLFKNYGQEYQKQCFINSFLIADYYLDFFDKQESISVVKLTVRERTKKKRIYWRRVLKYCQIGNMAASIDEYLYLLKECEGKNQDEVREVFEQVLKVHSSSINVDFQKKAGEIVSESMRCHFAVSYGNQKLTTETGQNRMINVRTVFNSPFRPFVLTSTSIGQEGLDFHYYCRKIFHWNLPHNAIDLEQREGRINRYKGFVIRKKIAEIISNEELNQHSNDYKEKSLWEIFFEIAKEKLSDNSGLKPFWYLDEGDTSIERFVPIHPLSKDQNKFDQLLKTLALYRLTFGQPRQEELIEAFNNSGLSDTQIKTLRETLLINLSPLKHH